MKPAAARKDETVLSIDHASVEFGRDRVLHDVSLRVKRGEFVGVLGPNGSGKTTLLRAALGLVPLATGRVELFGEDLRRFHDWARVAYVPQNASHVDPRFPATALEVVMLGRIERRGLLRWFSREDRRLALEALDEVEAGHLAGRRIGALSGGERQRVLLAKGLVGEPELLFLDEPTTGVDPQARAEFYELLDHLNHNHGLTVILVSHDTEALAATAHRIVAVNHAIVFDGTSKRFHEAERTSDIYRLAVSHGGRIRHPERGGERR